VRFDPQDDAVQNIERNISNNSTHESNEIGKYIKLFENQPDIVCPGDTCPDFLYRAKDYMTNKLVEFNRNMAIIAFVMISVYYPYYRFLKNRLPKDIIKYVRIFLVIIPIIVYEFYIFYRVYNMTTELKDYKKNIDSLKGYEIVILEIDPFYKYFLLLFSIPTTLVALVYILRYYRYHYGRVSRTEPNTSVTTFNPL
jgi:amino acid transporter